MPGNVKSDFSDNHTKNQIKFNFPIEKLVYNQKFQLDYQSWLTNNISASPCSGRLEIARGMHSIPGGRKW